MNGQLSEQPLAELIREISSKSFGGRMRLEHDRVKVVAYFDDGKFCYAASNLRTHRIREYLLKNDLVADQDLAQFNDRVSDLDLVRVLCAQKLLSTSAAEQVQTRQVSDILRFALLWTEGVWEFDSRSRLNETLNLHVDASSLLLDAGRRVPGTFAASRFPNPAELLTPIGVLLDHDDLLPAEVFLLSRLDSPMVLKDLVAVSGLGEATTLGLVYSLSLAGLIEREHWQSAFGDHQQPTPPPPPPPPPPEIEKIAAKPEQADVDLKEVESFLQRIKDAQTHYDVMGVNREVSAEDLKLVYYQLARRYHPDRFRKIEAALVVRMESAFARITQAYETLRDDSLRSSYNSKLHARRKAAQIADSAPKAATPLAPSEPVAEGVAAPVVSGAEQAELQFKEGFAAFELGQRKVALGLFASAANAVPNEPRYRAFYGHMLAGDERTRRAAEVELHAAIKLDPNNAEYRIMLAELYRDLGLKLRAKNEAERAVAADRNSQKARDLLRALK
jgi:curved DNA-binding protein CbpA